MGFCETQYCKKTYLPLLWCSVGLSIVKRLICHFCGVLWDLLIGLIDFCDVLRDSITSQFDFCGVLWNILIGLIDFCGVLWDSITSQFDFCGVLWDSVL